MAAIDDEFALQWGNTPHLNPDAWAAGTTVEAYMPPSGTNIWGDISGFISGIGSTVTGLFDVAGDVRDAQWEFKNNSAQSEAAYALAMQQQQQKFMMYGLIGAGLLLAIVLLKD